MKILLVKPPQNPFLQTGCLYEPLELEYLAASVKDHNVRIIDMRIDKDLSAEIEKFNPDIVGVTGYTTDYNQVVKILKAIKQQNNGITTVVGGHHATFSPEDYNRPFTNYVFSGYADTTFPRFVAALNNRNELEMIPDLGIVENGKIIFSGKDKSVPDLNSLPLPSRELTEKYHRKYHDSVMNRVALLMTSRGCPFRCNFCACWKLMDGKYAARTPESIIEELKSMPRRMEVVYFSDDNTFHDIDRMWKLNSLIKENGIRKKFQMYARADTVIRHQDLFRELTGSGLQFLTVGLESIRSDDLDYYNKKTSVEINNQAILILKKLNIHIMAHFIIRPEYGKEDFRELYRYVSRNNLFRPAYPVLTPLPGTDLYQEKYDEFQIRNYDYFDFVHSILPTRLSKKEFYRQLSGIYVKSYSPLRVIIHRLNRLLSINRTRYFTSNIDGASFIRFVLIYIGGIANFLKLRYYYVFKKGI